MKIEKLGPYHVKCFVWMVSVLLCFVDFPPSLFRLFLQLSPSVISAPLLKVVLSSTHCRTPSKSLTYPHTMHCAMVLALSLVLWYFSLWPAQTSTVCLGAVYYIKFRVPVFLHTWQESFLCSLHFNSFAHIRTCSLVTTLVFYHRCHLFDNLSCHHVIIDVIYKLLI